MRSCVIVDDRGAQNRCQPCGDDAAAIHGTVAGDRAVNDRQMVAEIVDAATATEGAGRRIVADGAAAHVQVALIINATTVDEARIAADRAINQGERLVVLDSNTTVIVDRAARDGHGRSPGLVTVVDGEAIVATDCAAGDREGAVDVVEARAAIEGTVWGRGIAIDRDIVEGRAAADVRDAATALAAVARDGGVVHRQRAAHVVDASPVEGGGIIDDRAVRERQYTEVLDPAGIADRFPVLHCHAADRHGGARVDVETPARRVARIEDRRIRCRAIDR